MALKLSAASDKLVVLDSCDNVNRATLRNLHYFVDLIIASNHELAEDILKKGVKVPVETIVDSHESNPEWMKVHVPKDRLRVTWYGVINNYFNFIEHMRPILSQDFIEFRWASNDNPKWNQEWGFKQGVQFEMDLRDAWRREDSWQYFIFNSDIGIVPVNNEAIKSPHKILNYMAYGIPVICSPTDSHMRIIRHGKNGFLASSDEDWIKYLTLLRDPQLRSKIGVEARKTALEEYSIQNVSDRYYQILMKYYDQKTTSERTLKQKALNFLSTIVPA